MKKLFLFVLAAALCCGCSESSIGDDSKPAELELNIHVAKRGTLNAVLAAQEIGVTSIVSLKITGVLNEEDFRPIRSMKNLRNLDLADINLPILPVEAFREMNLVPLHVVLPNTLTEIGFAAFYSCSLTSIEIPASVKTIQQAAFKDCSELATVTFEKGSNLETIGRGSSLDHSYGAFSDCISLTSIEIPASVETIGVSTFQGCSELATVTFEKGSMLKTIGSEAFLDCSSLTSIEIPASVETIGVSAFQGCSELATVTFEKGSQQKTISSNTFCGCSLTSIDIPASVETIGDYAFSFCQSLTTVTFEKGSNLKIIKEAFRSCLKLQTVDMSACTQVESIGSCAFYDCQVLKLFKIGTATPPKCGYYVFWGISSNAVLEVPFNCLYAYRNASEWCGFAVIISVAK